MKTLDTIKDDYAVSKGFRDYHELTLMFNYINIFDVQKHIDEVMILAQKECLKRASENVRMKTKSNIHELSMNDDWSEIDKDSITNENNLIK